MSAELPLWARPVGPKVLAIKLAGILLLSAVMICLVISHTPHVNGPPWWNWPWRRLSVSIYPLMIAASLPVFGAQWLHHRGGRRRTAMGLLMLATFAMQLAALLPQKWGLLRPGALAENPVITSYFSAAKVIHEQGLSLGELLGNYPALLPYMQIHAKMKPPGLVLYWLAIIRLFGTGRVGLMIGAMLVSVGATLAVPATDALVRAYTRDRRAGFAAASFMAICPSLLLFIPMFDQMYPVLACGMWIAWKRAMRDLRWAGVFGALLWLGSFISYIFLGLGVLLAVDTLLQLARGQRREAAHLIKAGAVATGVCAAIYALLWITLQFDPIATFQTINGLVSAHLVLLQRPWPQHIPWDFYDFCLGGGGISGLLAVYAICRWTRWPRRWRRMIFLCLVQIGILGASGALPDESARLWLPLYPLLAAMVGLELSRWPARARWIALACVVLIGAAIAQNMTFLFNAAAGNAPAAMVHSPGAM